MPDIAEKIIELRIATRRACMCEDSTKKKKNTLSLKSKILFNLSKKSLSPCELISSLQIAKANLTILTNQMVREGLIIKTKGTFDRREITYSITDEGREILKTKLDIIEKAFSTILTDEKDYNAAITKIDDVLSLLSFLAI